VNLIVSWQRPLPGLRENLKSTFVTREQHLRDVDASESLLLTLRENNCMPQWSYRLTASLIDRSPTGLCSFGLRVGLIAIFAPEKGLPGRWQRRFRLQKRSTRLGGSRGRLDKRPKLRRSQ